MSVYQNMSVRLGRGNSKEKMINPTTRITYNNYMMIIDYNLGSFKQSSYIFSKEEVISKDEIQAIYTLELPPEIKRRILNILETDNLKHLITMLTIDEAIDIIKAKIENESLRIEPSYIEYIDNSDNEELEI